MSWSPLHRGSVAGSDPVVRAGLTGAKVLPFKRRAVKTPRRKRSVMRALIQPFLTAVVLVACPTVAALWLLTSPRFAVAKVEVLGATQVPDAWVTRRLEPFLGRNLLGLDLGSAAQALGEHPWAEGFEVTKELPDRLVVTVRERRPAALLEQDGRSFFADAHGRPIAAMGSESLVTDAARLGQLPRVTDAGAGADAVPLALAVERELARIRPDWAAGPLEIEAISNDDVRLQSAALPFSLRLRPGDVEPKIRRLEELLPRLRATHREPGAVDLRLARRIIVEPAGRPAKVR